MSCKYFRKARFPWAIRGVLLSFSLLLTVNASVTAGPPFLTDDPEPVGFRNWEYYLSSMSTFRPHNWSGTAPHAEVNYGVIPDVQIHLLLPMNYTYVPGESARFGYSSTEIGIKYRFIHETDNRPQAGIFPIIELPTIKNQAFGNGRTQVYLPVWVQKSWGKLTTYGGAGFWFNPGAGNRNWLFSGWEVQYDFTPHLTLGSEIYYHTADTQTDRQGTGFNTGAIININENIHIIASAGHSITGENYFSSYLGLLITI